MSIPYASHRLSDVELATGVAPSGFSGLPQQLGSGSQTPQSTAPMSGALDPAEGSDPSQGRRRRYAQPSLSSNTAETAGRSPCKRAYRRALRQAQLHGFTYYRGHRISAADAARLSTADGGTGPGRTRSGLGPNENKKNNRRKAREHRARLISIFSWNVQALSSTKFHEILNRCHSLGIKVVALQSTRWKFSQNWVHQHYHIFHTGPKFQNSEREVGGTMLCIHKSLLGSNTIVSSGVWLQGRIQVVRIKFRNHDITLINGYAPQNEAPPDQRDAFWNALHHGLRQLPVRTSPIITLDSNGHVGKPPRPLICGKFFGADENNNGKSLIDICRSFDMQIVNTQFNDDRSGWTWQLGDASIRTLFNKSRLYSHAQTYVPSNQMGRRC